MIHDFISFDQNAGHGNECACNRKKLNAVPKGQQPIRPIQTIHFGIQWFRFHVSQTHLSC